jgi:uncharacterized membrane protein HdeD (DUF308 family)
MHANVTALSRTATWLKGYYFTRFAVSAAWVALAFTVGNSIPTLAAAMLVAYPLWDALANYADARQNGGLSSNKTQMLNFVVSIVTAAAVAIALGKSMHAVLAVFGVWAVFAGIFQLATALRRRKSTGAQWAMILSGVQSALAGIFFVKMAAGPATVGITDVAPYAAFGAFYFFVSAAWLAVSDARSAPARSI